MLNAIKELINQKHAFQEAADLILENDDLDDSIILNEGPDEIPEPNESDEIPTEDAPIGNDELPEPISSTTGEPAQIGDDDLLSVEIDLATNTPKDILPTPPASASDAVSDDDDILNQRIDSGFGNDEPAPVNKNDSSDLLDQPIDDEGDKPLPDNNSDVAESEDSAEDNTKEITKETVDELVNECMNKYPDLEPEDIFEERGFFAQLARDSEKAENQVKTISAFAVQISRQARQLCKDMELGKADQDNVEDTVETLTALYKGNESIDVEQMSKSIMKLIAHYRTRYKSAKKAGKTEKAEKIKSDLNKFISRLQKAKKDAKKVFDIIDAQKDEVKTEYVDIRSFLTEYVSTFTEAIVLDGNAEGGDSSADEAGAAADALADDGSAPDSGQKDSAVTAAVKDKLAETETDDSGLDGGSSGKTVDKEDLLKKLGNLTKGLEDAKKAVMDAIQ